ncbi:putative mismatch-specific thymine-DNA glycosylase [Aspergillus nomiae NRRL 13137]|uniref:Putative mismatch-specific thymine-DNA glycosylase n=1 Tax=Aspergillus nomiae NRRL (strain ATCC 15546 / NRRL 13137 / CBS 260.88 / M93) TaxID=1509407 RepID=A0A0L1J6W7_ASPN3|nr:putative mismatch-specific thymine-DNA glycosylase [Aspergillus nomiae NRRL 13137]KNG87556.1 putative mismatch-specific thymine-DNA glycosylase [Aspergillus nomiae NRRL 13137]
MGRLIKNHWARLIILTAAAYQVGSAIEGFIWPKVFWDFMTKNLNGAVKPIPVLQILNLLLGLLGLAWEWPLKYFAGTLPHRSIEFRLILYPLSALLSMLLYQGTDPAIYYLVGIGVYFWAYSEGEVVCAVPWTLPKRNSLKLPQSPGSGMSPPASNEDFHIETALATDDTEDVPVNKKTSFNGRLNQYFHMSKNIPSRQDTLSKRKSESESNDQASSNDNDSNSKRRKKAVSAAVLNLPKRITRSRSASSSSPASLASPSPSPATEPSTPGRSRARRQPSSRVNPGIMTGATGHVYAHPSNLYWKLLHWSGITTIRHPPSDTYRLPELYNIGNTNIVERPTRDASMLSKAEMDAGVPVLEEKVAKQRPEAVCLVGKSIWEAVWRVRKGRAIRKEEFRYGWQDESENMGRGEGWNGAPVFVATTTSGLAAGMSMAEKQAVWNELGKWVKSRREAKNTRPM